MTRAKIMSHRALKEQMKAVARGERPAPPDAARPSFESAEALVRLLTPENRRLLSVIRDRKPGSIVELAALTGRAPSNLTRTLAKLEAMGLIALREDGRRKVPVPAVKTLRLEIDPYSDRDILEFA